MEEYTEVFAWGGDHFGQLGLGNKHTGKTYPSPKLCSFNILIKEISCGEEHSAFISYSAHVYSMGSNSEGRLGIGDKSIRSSSSPCLIESLSSFRSVKVSCGWGHTGVVTDDGSLFTWGVGEFGALGNGSPDSLWHPTKAQLGRGLKALDVNSGSRHTGVIVEEGRNRILMMSGSGEAGQLGTGRREKEFRFVSVALPEDVNAVACGVFHSLVLINGGKVYAMGGNSFGQLGIGTKKSCSKPERVNLEGNAVKIACGNHSAAINDRGFLFVWGTGAFGEYLVPTRLPVTGCKDVSIGGNFGMAVDLNGELFAWGANSNGELGVGDFELRNGPTLVVQLKGKNVKKVSCGGNYVIGLGCDVFDAKNQLAGDSEYRTKREESAKKNDSVKRPGFEEKNRNESEGRNRERLRESDGFKYRESERITPVKFHRNGEGKTEQRFERNTQSRTENRPNRDNEELRAKEVQSNLALRSAFEESQRQVMVLNQEIRNYKEEIQRAKRALEDMRLSHDLEVSHKIEDINQALSHRHQIELQEIRLGQEQETIKRRQLEKSLDVSSKHIGNLEEAVQKSNQENSDLKKQNLSLSRSFEDFKLNTQQDLDKYQRENSELRRKIDGILSEKDRNEASLNKENTELKRKIDSVLAERERTELALNKEMNDAKRKFEVLLGEKERNEHSLNKEISELRRDNDGILLEKDRLESSYKAEIGSLALKLNDFQVLISNLTAENDHINTIFSHESDKNHQEINEYRNKLEQLIREKEISIKSLKNEVSILENELSSTKMDLDSKYKEVQHLSMQLSEKNMQNSNLNQESSSLKSEKDYQIKLLEDLKYQNTKSQQDLLEINKVVDRLRAEIKNWERDYAFLIQENTSLKETVAELEMKNRQLFENLEKELAQRAKEYKERTISVLNAGRCVSPYQKGHFRESSAELNMSDIKIEKENSPTFAVNPKYKTIAQAYRGTSTPTKDDLRTRISSLMRNREKIEEQLQNF